MNTKGLRLLFCVAVIFILPFAQPFSTHRAAAAGPDRTVSTSETWDAGEYNYGNLTITSGATLFLKSDPSRAGFQGVQLNVVNLTVENGAAISGDGLGYPSHDGPGAGTSSAVYGGGASHGGYGGNGIQTPIVDGPGSTVLYGDPRAPVDLGSGGGMAAYAGAPGGAGGRGHQDQR